MSAKSDQYEKDVAAYINNIPGVEAQRPPGDTGYSDVLINYKNKKAWLEVKMNHTDNLANPRMYYSGGKWKTTYSTPVARSAVALLNTSPQAKKFVQDLANFAKIPLKDIKIPTTKSGLKEPGAVPLDVMKSYFDQPGVNRYIASKEMDLGTEVIGHYTKGKKQPAYYMQAGDDFYLISKVDPLGIGKGVPQLTGTGDYKVRVSTRSEFYEIQAEIKIINMGRSAYSLKPGTNKKNPFLR